MGQEERKNKAKMEKTQIQLASTSNEYEAAVKVLEETTGRWNREWKAACDKFQDLEEERLDFAKSSLWTFANVASTVCVSDDAVSNISILESLCSHLRSRVNGFACPWRGAKSKKMFHPSFASEALDKRYLIPRSTSILPGATSMTQLLKSPKMRTIL